jgi:hypothetical protein
LACLLQLDFPFDIVFATGWRLTRIQIVCQSHHRKDLGIHGIFHV